MGCLMIDADLRKVRLTITDSPFFFVIISFAASYSISMSSGMCLFLSALPRPRRMIRCVEATLPALGSDADSSWCFVSMQSMAGVALTVCL